MPVAIDLFCGGGGVSRGLLAAGFDTVIGIDVRPLARWYRASGGRFVQGDALRPPIDLSAADFIWASPPCQAYTVAGHLERSRGREYPDLIESVREMLSASGRPWAMENVPGAPIRPDLELDGTMFPGLRVVRRRLFEVSGFRVPFRLTGRQPGLVRYGGFCSVVGSGICSGTPRTPDVMAAHRTDNQRRAMGIDWLPRRLLTQAVPPAYAEYIGRAAIASMEDHP